jgi:hypothetical protein
VDTNTLEPEEPEIPLTSSGDPVLDTAVVKEVKTAVSAFLTRLQDVHHKLEHQLAGVWRCCRRSCVSRLHLATLCV